MLLELYCNTSALYMVLDQYGNTIHGIWNYTVIIYMLLDLFTNTIHMYRNNILQTWNLSQMHGYYPCEVFFHWGKINLLTYSVCWLFNYCIKKLPWFW